jgi:hypothetical protein
MHEAAAHDLGGVGPALPYKGALHTPRRVETPTLREFIGPLTDGAFCLVPIELHHHPFPGVISRQAESPADSEITEKQARIQIWAGSIITGTSPDLVMLNAIIRPRVAGVEHEISRTAAASLPVAAFALWRWL